MADGDDAEPVPLWGTVAGFVAAVACGVYLFSYTVRNSAPYLSVGDYASFAGHLLAQSMLATLLLWVLFFLAVLRNHGRPGTGTLFYAVFLAILLAIDGGGALVIDHIAAAQAELTVDDKVQIANYDILVRQIDVALRAVDTPVLPTGTDPFSVRARAFITGANDVTQTSRIAFKALDYPQLLKPARLGKRDFGPLHDKLAQLRAIPKTYDAKIDALVADYRHWLQTAPMSQNVRRYALSRFEAIVANFRMLRARDNIYHNKIFDEEEAMLDDLTHAKGSWSTKGNVIYFADHRDLEAYNFHIEVIRGYEEQAAAIEPKPLKR